MPNIPYEDITLSFSENSGSYEITEAEIIEFGKRFDPQPFHIDPIAAKDSFFGELVAPGCLLFAIRAGLFNQLDQRPDFIAGLGIENMDLQQPACVGDQLFLTVTCSARRESKSRPDAGIVHLQQTLRNQHDEVVLTMTAKLLVKKKK